MIQTCLV